jgi:hypothetical protein
MKKYILITVLLGFSPLAMASDYWSDVVGLCLKYSEATHPPCNKANGARVILNEVARSCPGNLTCLDDAVVICSEYSLATHPPCNPANGLTLVLEGIEQASQFYP